MRKSLETLFVTVLGLMTSVLLSRFALADGDVIVRPSTPEEKNFIISTMQALKSAVGKLPAGWTYNSESTIAAEESLRFAGKKEYPIETSYSAQMQLSDGLAERQAVHDKVIADTESIRGKLEALMRQAQEKGMEADKARADGNRAAYEKAKAEMEESQNEYAALSEGSENPYKTIADAQYELTRDTAIQIRAVANSLSQQINGELVPLDIPGAALAVRVDPSDRTRPSRALVLFGDWNIERFGEGNNQSVVARRIPRDTDKLTKVFNVAVRLESDRERLNSIAQAIDEASLRSLM